MCENTLLAMNQILTAMQEEGPAFLLDLSREERRAFKELFNACEDFLNASEELEDQVEEMASGFDEKETEEIN